MAAGKKPEKVIYDIALPWKQLCNVTWKCLYLKVFFSMITQRKLSNYQKLAIITSKYYLAPAKSKSLFLVQLWHLIQMRKNCSSVLVFNYTQYFNCVRNIVSIFHITPFPKHKYLAATHINTRNVYEKWKCEQRSVKFCVLYVEINIKKNLNVID